MARLRFPGRPGCRFGRLGVRYGADEADNYQNPMLAWVANIHRGLRQFRELCGESDEDEEFEGFTAEDVRKAERALAKYEAELYSEDEDTTSKVSPNTSVSPISTSVKISTRFAKQRESLENLPTSDRTRNREKAVVPRSYKDVLKKGFAKPSKSYFIKSRKDIDTPQAETKKALTSYYKAPKVSSPEMVKYYEQGFRIKVKGKFKGARVIHGAGRPKYLKTVVRKSYVPSDNTFKGSVHLHSSPEQEDVKHHRKRKERDKKKFPVVSSVIKRGRKNIVKSLLDKAKKGKDDSGKHKLPVKKKQFVLPTQSSRSSRVIIPNKRFIEDDNIQVVKKKKENYQNIFDTSLSTSFKQPFSSPSSQKKIDKLHIQTDFPVSTGFGSFSPDVYRKASLFDQPLITEGKRERKPSQKLKVKMVEGPEDEFVDVISNTLHSDEFSKSRKVHLTPSKLGQSMHSPTLPIVAPIFAPPKFGSTPFRSLTQQSQDVEAKKRSGHNILRKAKLQLNRAAVNRSKVALAKSLKKEMKREEKNRKKIDKSSLGYSTYSGRSKNFMDEDGPENVPVQKLDTVDSCEVCGGGQPGRLIRRCICTSCYKCYKRYGNLEHEPCLNNGTCDPTIPNKTMCRPCKYRKSRQVYMSAIRKSDTKTPLKCATSKNKTPEKIIEGKKKLTERFSNKKGFRKKQSHVQVIETPVPVVMETDEPASPTPPAEETAEHSDATSPESHTSPKSTGRGPRIKHVCRKAAVVLGKTVARFPQTELTLSALPKGEKKRILKQDELDKAAYSDDEKTIEEIIQEAEEGVDTYIKSPPVKIIPKMRGSKTPPTTSLLKMIKRKRKLRCKKCAGCLAVDCGKCNYCLDKPKFGGRGVQKQACIDRRCSNPVYYKAATPLTLQPKDDDSRSNSPNNPQCSSDGDSEMNNNNNTNNSSKSCLNVLRRFGPKSNVSSKTSTNQQTDQVKDVNLKSSDKTPATVSRQLQFAGNSQGVQHQLTNISRVSSRAQNSGRMATKTPSVFINRSELSLTQQSRSTSYHWTRMRPQDQAQHRLKADFKEIYNVWTAWQFGVSLTVAAPLCCRTVCYLCGSAGKHELFYCNVCCEPYHEFCLEEDEKPSSDNLENWVCQKCQFCTVCGQQKNLLKCDKCQNTYHPECLGPNYPTKPSKKKNIWICTKCVKCKSCGATTPGTTSNATWTHDFQLCYVCGQLMDKGNFCPICHSCYSDDDWDCKMVQCAKCESWVHAKCEGLSDEMYERVSCLPEDVHYICRMCAGHRPRHWELVLKDDFIAGIKSIFYSIFNAKCSKYLTLEDKKPICDKNIVIDENSKDSVSIKETKCDINSDAMEMDKPISLEAAIDLTSVRNPTNNAEPSTDINMSSNIPLHTQCDENKIETVAMETDEKRDNSVLNCDSKVVNVCDKESDIIMTSKPLDEPDGNKSYVLKTAEDVELFIKNLEGLVQKKVIAENSKSDTNTISQVLQNKDQGLLSETVSETKSEKSIRFSTDSNSSSVSCKTEVTHKTPEKNGAVVRFKENLPKPIQTRDYPKDLMTVRQKIIAGIYNTVEDFSEDIAYIIEAALTDTEEQGVVRKKAINSVRSIFVKQMEKCFPWYNVKACRMWEHNRFLPHNMLPEAVLPPFEDHTYAQWLEREDVPRSPQPSPFKKVVETPIKNIFPVVDPDEEGEKVLSSDLADDGQDTRRCILCWHYGDADPNGAGRLLYGGQDDWVHVNCALWSAEVYEEGQDGALQNVHEAVSRGRKMKCDTCQRTGATVGCNTRGCPANYHFMCARMDGCLFQDDRKVFCSQHGDKIDGHLVSKDKFAVLRRICVDREGMKFTKKTWAKGLTAAELNILIGSCTIESIGNLTALSDCKGLLLPVGFSCTRVYWSTKDSRRRCVYTCKITEYRPESPKTPVATIKDMTIIHDEKNPGYVPLSQLELPVTLKRANIIDLTEDSTHSGDSSRTLIASFDKTRTSSIDCDDSLSASWPGPSKKRKSDPVPLDLSLLSPTTLRLLNKDPDKYKKEHDNSELNKSSNKSLPSAVPVAIDNPLTEIASRLNRAAAKSRQKSEERTIAGITTAVVSNRPSSAPLFARSRSNSAERLVSPPRLCSSPISETLPPVKETSDVINVDEIDQEKVNNQCVSMETDELMKSMDIDENLETIINELSGENENALIVITDDGQELSEEDYSMIAEYAMKCDDQSAASETNNDKSSPAVGSIILSSNTEIVKSDSVQEIQSAQMSSKRSLTPTDSSISVYIPPNRITAPTNDISFEGPYTQETTELDQKETTEPVGNNQKETIEPVGNDQKETTELVGNYQKETTEQVGNDQKETTEPVGNDQKEMTEPVGNDQKEMTEPVGNDQKEMTEPVGNDQKETTEPVGNDQNESIEPVGNDQKEAEDDETSVLVAPEKLHETFEIANDDLDSSLNRTSTKNTNITESDDLECMPSVVHEIDCSLEKEESMIDVNSKSDLIIATADCPVLEKSIGNESELELTVDSDINTEQSSMPVLTIESPMKTKMDRAIDASHNVCTKGADVIEIDKHFKDLEGINPVKMIDGVDMESDKSKLYNPLEKRDRKEEEKIQEPPNNFLFRNSDSFILDEETGDFVPKLESPVKEVPRIPLITAKKSKKQRRTEEPKTPPSKSRNLFEALNLSPTETIEDEEQKEEVLKGLGLERAPSPRQEKERKSYPLRRRSVLKEEMKEELNIPLHDKLTQKIKAESMAKSSPGEEGPFKCQTCKRHYRTLESYKKHVSNCDFEVSSTTDEEDEKEEESGIRKGRYPMRETTIVQSVVSQVEEQERKSGWKKPGRRSLDKKQNTDLSPKVVLARLSPSKLMPSKKFSHSTLTSPLEKGKERSPKIVITSAVDEKSQSPMKAKQNKCKPSLQRTPEIDKQHIQRKVDTPRPRGRPRLSDTIASKKAHVNLKDQNRNTFTSIYSSRKYGKFHKRSKSDGLLFASRIALSENPYAKQYSIKKASARYREKRTHLERSEKFRKPSDRRDSRRKSDISGYATINSTRRKSIDKLHSNDSSASFKEVNKSKTLESSTNDVSKSTEDIKESTDHEETKAPQLDDLSTLELQVKRKRGRPRKNPAVNKESKVSAHPDDNTADNKSGDTSEVHRKMEDQSEYDNILDREIKQEMLDNEEEMFKVEKPDVEGESMNRNRKSSSNDSEEKQCERLVQNEKDIGCEKDQVEIRGITQNEAILGSAARPMVIDDEDDDLDAKDSIHQSSKHKRVCRKRKEQSPRKSTDEEPNVYLKSSPGVKALSEFLAQKEKTPPKNEPTTPDLSSPRETSLPKQLFKSMTSDMDTVEQPSQIYEQSSMNKSLFNFVTDQEGSEKSSRQKNVDQIQQSVKKDDRNKSMKGRRSSDEAKINVQCRTNTDSPRSRNSSGHSEDRNIFKILNKDSPPKNEGRSSSSYSAIKPAAEYSQQSRGPPPLMTPSLIGLHNPSVSMTAFQNLQQRMPHALQQIHGTNPQVVPHTQQMSKPIDLTQMSAPVPAQAAIQSTFDMDQHINRMIRETSLAAGPIHQNQILQQMVLNQSIQAGITSQNQPMINQPSCHTVVPNKTNQPSPQIVSESKDQQYHINQPKTSPVTLGNDLQTDSCKSKLIPYHQLLQKSLTEKGTIVPKFIKSNNQAILPAIQSNPLSRAQSVNHPQQSTSTAVVPQQKTSTGAKPNTIVRIFVDGKPVALTTDPTVLQDHASLLNKLGGGQIQSGTYSVTVSAHRVPSRNTSPIDSTSNQLCKIPAIQPVLPHSKQLILPQSPNDLIAAQYSEWKCQDIASAGNSNNSSRPNIPSTVKDALDSQLGSRLSSITGSVSQFEQNQVLSSLLSKQNQFHTNLGLPTTHHSLYSRPSSEALPREIHELMRKVPLPERQTPSISVQPKIMTSYVKKLDGTIQKKTLVKPMIVNRKRPAINPINIMGSASKKPLISTYMEKNGIVQGLLSKVYMRKLVKDASPKPKMVDSMQQTPRSIHNYAGEEKKRGRKILKKPGRKKTPQKSRNISKPHAGASTSHPIIHGPKEVTSLPQAAVEEEVTESSMMSFMEHQLKVQEKAERREKNGAHLMFEITSDDGFSCKAESMEEAWQQVTERVQDARTTARMKHLSCASIHGVNMFGVNHNAVVYLLEQLYGAQLCRNYKFRYQQYTRKEEEEEPIENPTGSIRSEAYQSRKEFDIFSFLMSQYRRLPEMDLTEGDNEMNLKSQRRATSMDLPMAMRFRKLKEHAREAVGVYRSYIHGRGLYCKRNIDAGEMIIEYSGEVIRGSLTDKREQYYESKGIGCYMFRIDDTDVVDATLHGSAARFINHSCEPNCYSKVIQVEGKKHIVIFAMRQIKKGEELTYDYKFPIEEVKIPCTCGSKKCRKYLN